MKDKQLAVDIKCKIQWLHPPKDMPEQVMREHAGVLAQAMASRLNLSVQLVILEMLNCAVEGK